MYQNKVSKVKTEGDDNVRENFTIRYVSEIFEWRFEKVSPNFSAAKSEIPDG